MKNKIKQLRDELNVSQTELSESTGISVENLNSIETGKVEPSLIDAHKIKKALNKKYFSEVFFLDDLE